MYRTPILARTLTAACLLACASLSHAGFFDDNVSTNTPSGAAGGSTAENANSKLERCEESMGTIAVHEDHDEPWWHTYASRYPQLGTTTPVLRMMIQQSNCFVVVERGKAMKNMKMERELEESGELRKGSKFGKGQMVSADYTMSPNIQFAQKGTGGLGGAIGGLFGNSLVGAIAGGLSTNEASTTLLLIDNRSGVQVSAAQGSGKNFDFNLFGGFFGGGLAGGAGAFSSTPEGKVIMASFADSYNQMVRALRNYKAQTVKGGLGKGGTLKVAD